MAEATKRTFSGKHQAIDTRDAAYKGVMREERERADQRGLGDRQRQVYLALVEAGPEGATNDELSEALGVPANAVTPRMYELRGLGDDNPLSDDPLALPLRRDGELLKRPTRTGNRAQVWVATAFVDRPEPTVEIAMVHGTGGGLDGLHRVTVRR